ncbi:MAG: tetratricopeptide repeat protein [Sterolibacteriaceae bacterium]|jgi:tetratricopeptide (TPR) repeat protein|nr:tetratricopeptide repeat protein [Sterolibacteriaceae bacterium]MBK9083978.1 tetratricopeptide repeat protein [Sterolibacteriaceae bacterium]
MSLLMDALKKAEAAKRQAAQAERAAASDSPPDQANEPANALPELPHELSLLDDQFAASPGAAVARGGTSPAAGVSDAQRDRAAAHNLFAAKRSASRAPFWIGLTTSTMAAVAAIGFWFWWQLKPPAGALQAGPALAQLSATPAPAAMSALTPQTGAQQAPVADAAPSAPIVDAEPAAATRAPDSQRRVVSRPRPPAMRAADPARAGSFAAPPPAPAVQAPTGPRVRRAALPREQINPAVAQGYAAYSAGDLESAKRHYEEALRADPRSLDALNGMTAIALRAGRGDLAEAYLARALEVDPHDPYALSSLAALKGRSDPQTAERRLRGLIAAAPDSPAANFSLGNLYARDGRWGEAQQAYFRAFAAEPDNPDYQFNLAVSLDHIRQSRLALQYYQSALAAARPGAFDRERAAIRVRDLQQVQ